ncbi:diaminopimelate epimerase [Criblamydia sequanensis]|uniref:Diaminopimelate epimerase n=1 Tax=Candidatus Criblamydia sequanensis CRIB-18 TaxID=1437425 RepID=A0A090DXF8_9BACT|nr:diaminopimelate epimerase [Criblamydia sequanensis]CDR33499.1 Diaminopimelate epimerase [Criblamydia sequanensis CRIB-18]
MPVESMIASYPANEKVMKSEKELSFAKYSGAGNDFILIDNRSPHELNWPLIAKQLCHRKEGIGADGLILLELSDRASFRLRFFNSDGSEAEMCGNGARTAVHFAASLGIQTKNFYTLQTKERILEARLKDQGIEISLGEVLDIQWHEEIELNGQPWRFAYLNTGVPHVVHFASDIESFPLLAIGSMIRHHEAFKPNGTNFNVVKLHHTHIEVRTFERGVEDETLACGTGVAASALAASVLHGLKSPIQVHVKSGDILEVNFTLHHKKPQKLTLLGPVKRLFDGVFTLSV